MTDELDPEGLMAATQELANLWRMPTQRELFVGQATTAITAYLQAAPPRELHQDPESAINYAQMRDASNTGHTHILGQPSGDCPVCQRAAPLREDGSHEQNLIKAERDALREYVKVLGEADSMTAVYLDVHGWHYPQELLDRAADLRDEIASYALATVAQDSRP
jgi:hypothetical protein